MKIKQVEELVGITSKNIRFYEEQNLINPQRADNGYREYSMEDVKLLKKIKLFRKLGISVEEINKLLNGKSELATSLERRKLELLDEQKNLESMYKLANEMIDRDESINSIDSDLWLDVIENKEKEGVDFVNLDKIDIRMKKKAGATTAGVVMAIVMVLYIALFTYLWRTQNLPTLAYIPIVIIPVLGLIALFVALKSRIREINGGEEDEASKY